MVLEGMRLDGVAVKALGLWALLQAQFAVLAASTLFCVYAQWWCWVHVVDLSPKGYLLFGSLYYFPLLLIPTALWWARLIVCRIEKWPMPVASGMILGLMWLPATFTPAIVLIQIVLMFSTIANLWKERKQ